MLLLSSPVVLWRFEHVFYLYVRCTPVKAVRAAHSDYRQLNNGMIRAKALMERRKVLLELSICARRENEFF